MTNEFVDWGSASEPLPGESVSGDRCLVRNVPGGLLIAGVDGVGHGPEAARAADAAIEALSAHAERPLDQLLLHCQDALLGTRGAVALVVAYSAAERTLGWAGIGDVLGAVIRADPHARPACELLMPHAGFMGRGRAVSPPSYLSVGAGDLLVIATDGIQREFLETVKAAEDPVQLAERVIAGHRKSTDDAMVLAARFHGRSA